MESAVWSVGFGNETLIYAGFAVATGGVLSFSDFGKPTGKCEAILGFVGICSLLALRVSNDETV